MAMPPQNKKAPRRESVEYRLKIDAFSPATIPMARLAEYMTELSLILGTIEAVHFSRLLGGSTVLACKVEREAIPKVRERTSAVRRGDGPSEAQRAYKSLNKLLRDDNATGVLRDTKAGGVVLHFPGRKALEENVEAVKQYGTIDGTVIRVGGADETAHVTLESEHQVIANCYTTRAIAKELAHKMYESVLT